MRFDLLLLAALMPLYFPAEGTKKIRNMHQPCEIVINEILLFGENPFIELGKLCEDPGQINGKKKLINYYLMLLEFSPDSTEGKLFASWNLNEEMLVQPAGSISASHAVDMSSKKRKKGRVGMPKSDDGSRAGVPQVTPSPVTESPGEFDAGFEDDRSFHNTDIDCERSFLCRQKRDATTGNSTILRHRRANEPSDQKTKTQPNAYFFYIQHISGLSYNRSKSYVVFLLRLFSEDARQIKAVKKMFQPNSVLSQEARQKIKDRLIDFVIVSSQEMENQVRGFLSETDIVKAQQHGNDGTSLSKCDEICAQKQHSFESSLPSPNYANVCRDKDPVGPRVSYPYDFQGNAFRSQSKRLILNIYTAASAYRYNDWLMNMNPVTVTQVLTNVGKGTIYELIRDYKAADGKPVLHTPGKKRSRASPVTDLDIMKASILYNTVVAFYARKEIPKLGQLHVDYMKAVNDYEQKQVDEDFLSDENAEEKREDYHIGLDSFREILRKQGFKYGKIRKRDSVVFNPYISARRETYLKKLRQFREDNNVNIIYQDETWQVCTSEICK